MTDDPTGSSVFLLYLYFCEPINLNIPMYRHLLLKAAAAFLAIAMISCEKHKVENPDQPGQETLGPDQSGTDQPGQGGDGQENPEKPALKENAYELDGVQASFGSVALSNIGDYICIAATPSEGVESFEEVFEQEEYFYVAISPLLNGKEFDMTKEAKVFTVMSTLEGAYLESVAPTLTEEITSGTCLFNYKEGVAMVEVSIVLADGAELSVKMSAEEIGVVVNENIFAIGGNEKLVRTAFRMVEDGTTTLYLTPAGIEYFEDIDITTYYAYIILESGKCHGRTLTVEDVIAVGYADNFNELVVDSREVATTGTLNIAADPNDMAHYVVALDLDFAGTSLKIRFDGETLDALAKEVVTNEVVYNGTSLGIKEVYVDFMPNPECLTTVMIFTERDDVVYIKIPNNYLDGNAHGFSQSQNLYIRYDGVVYSKANGYSGTVTVSFDDDTIKINATNYDNLEITYEGPYEADA